MRHVSQRIEIHWPTETYIIYQNDPMAKPDFMVMVPDLYRRRRRRQARRRVPRHSPDPQGHLKNVFCPEIIY